MVKDKEIDIDKLDSFLEETKDSTQTFECKDDVCIIKNDKSLIEVVRHKKVITDDGRQLLT
tara:strand:+ start:9768 stop:9950 length:183 start_codon:yes stop_codon:yes gene_type:complete